MEERGAVVSVPNVKSVRAQHGQNSPISKKEQCALNKLNDIISSQILNTGNGFLRLNHLLRAKGTKLVSQLATLL